MCENGSCGCGNGGGRDECGGGYQSRCGPSSADYAFLLNHWAKKELLKEKVKKRMEAAYGKQLDAVADLIVEFVKDSNETEEELGKKEEALQAKMDGVFEAEGDD